MVSPDNESRRRGNHERPKSGIPKRKKTSTRTQLSCKIEYLLRPNQREQSSTSEFFTGDYVIGGLRSICCSIAAASVPSEECRFRNSNSSSCRGCPNVSR